MVSSPPPSGIYVPVPTFFASQSASNYDPVNNPLDLETQTKHSIFLVKGGVRGLVILGSTGEAIHLTNKERNSLITSQRKELDTAGFKDRPIIAGTATQNIEETLIQLEDAKKAGAEYGMVLTPGYFASAASQQGIAKWFEAVADKSPIPIMIYHYPGVTNNVVVAPSTFERLAQHPNIVGCKLSHGDIPDHTLIASSPKIDPSHFKVFSGLGQNLLPVLTIGGQGAIDGLAGIFPRVVVKLFNLFQEGADNKQLRELQFKICEGERLIGRWGTVGIKEAISRCWGFGDKEGARLPLQGGFQGGEQEWSNWSGVYEGLKKLEQEIEKKDKKEKKEKERGREKERKERKASTALVKIRPKKRSDGSPKIRRRRQYSSSVSPAPRDRKPKAIEFDRSTSTSPAPDSNTALMLRPEAGSLALPISTRAELFMSFINKGPESERGVSVNKALKRYHRERHERREDDLHKVDEEKELWKDIRLKRNDRGEIVLFFAQESE